MTPEQIQALRAECATKTARINELINVPSPSADAIRQAKALHEECKGLKSRIEAADGEARELAELRGGAKAAADWLTSTGGNAVAPAQAPIQGQGQGQGDPRFDLKGWQDAGHSTFRRERDGTIKMVDEAGPGQFGAKKWELFGSLEYKAHFFQYLREGERALDTHYKTLMEGRDTQGGVFAPADMIQRIIGREPAPTRLKSLVQTITTGKDLVEMPRKQYNADDKYTTAFRASWTGETPADGTGDSHGINDKDVFGTVAIPIHTAMLSGALSKNLLEDSAFPIQSWLESELNQVVELLYEEMIATGDGNGKPHGILFGAASTNDGTHPQFPEVILSGSAGALTVDLIDDMQTALAEQYENENTRWVMNKKSTLRALRKLKDSANRPLFTMGAPDYGIVGARGRVLMGDPIAVSAFMPNVGAANFPIVYGDLKGYLMPQRIGFSIQVLDQTRAKRNQVELVGRVRFGGKVVEPFRLKIGKSNNS